MRRLKTSNQLLQVGNARYSRRGPQQTVYCNTYQPPADQLLHEVRLTTVLLSYPEAEISRSLGHHTESEPDGLLKLREVQFALLLDVSCQPLDQLLQRMERFADFAGMLLIVTSHQKRLQQLLPLIEPTREFTLLTTFDRATQQPHGPIWHDCFGNDLTLNQSQPIE